MFIWKSSDYYNIDGAGVQSEPWNWRDYLNECVCKCKLGILMAIAFPQSSSTCQILSGVFLPRPTVVSEDFQHFLTPPQRTSMILVFLNVSHYAHDTWIH